MNKQILYDVAPRWQRYANLWYAGNQIPPQSTAWRLILMDNPPIGEVGALGYHETVGHDIIPLGYVFNEYAKSDNVPWTVTASHEVLEMLGNEWINASVLRDRPDGTIEIWPREWCDAVQGSSYIVNGVPLSNFVLPEYFSDLSDGPFDLRNELKAPFSIGSGGYSSILILNPPSKESISSKILYGQTYPEWRKMNRHHSRIKKMATGYLADQHLAMLQEVETHK